MKQSFITSLAAWAGLIRLFHYKFAFVYSLVFLVGGRYSISIPLFGLFLLSPLYTLRLGPFLFIYSASYLSKKKWGGGGGVGVGTR